MEFEFYGVVDVSDVELREMYLKVKKGHNLDEVVKDWALGLDDADYYNIHYVIDDIKREIQKRVKQSQKALTNKITML